MRATEPHGGWKLQSIDVVVPEGVNGFKVGARCNAEINTGLIRVDQISFTKYDVGCRYRTALADSLVICLAVIHYLMPEIFWLDKL